VQVNEKMTKNIRAETSKHVKDNLWPEYLNRYRQWVDDEGELKWRLMNKFTEGKRLNIKISLLN
jgi:hypothetical protein